MNKQKVTGKLENLLKSFNGISEAENETYLEARGLKTDLVWKNTKLIRLEQCFSGTHNTAKIQLTA